MNPLRGGSRAAFKQGEGAKGSMRFISAALEGRGTASTDATHKMSFFMHSEGGATEGAIVEVYMVE